MEKQGKSPILTTKIGNSNLLLRSWLRIWTSLMGLNGLETAGEVGLRCLSTNGKLLLGCMQEHRNGFCVQHKCPIEHPRQTSLIESPPFPFCFSHFPFPAFAHNECGVILATCALELGFVDQKSIIFRSLASKHSLQAQPPALAHSFNR